MSGRFAESAVTLCAIAARTLGWRPHEFWAATPAELAACLADPSGGSPQSNTLWGALAPTAPLGRGDLLRLMESDPDGHR